MAESEQERDERYKNWMASFAMMLEGLHATTAELTEANRQQAIMNQDVKRILAGVDISVARLEALTARVFREGDNGRDA